MLPVSELSHANTAQGHDSREGWLFPPAASRGVTTTPAANGHGNVRNTRWALTSRRPVAPGPMGVIETCARGDMGPRSGRWARTCPPPAGRRYRCRDRLHLPTRSVYGRADPTQGRGASHVTDE